MAKKHKKAAFKCQCCEEGIEAVIKWQKDCLYKYGWYMHFVPVSNSHTAVNFHTHGIQEKFNHPDFQIVIAMRPEVAHAIFSQLYEAVSKGMKYEVGKIYDDIAADGYKAQFIEATECGRKVLRLIVPDKNNRFKGQGVTKIFLDQWTIETDIDLPSFSQN